MIVTINRNGVDTMYMVTWKHEHPKLNGKMIKMSDYDRVISHGGTKCFIWEVSEDEPSFSPGKDAPLKKKLVATGEARCYKGDCFTKETGRKVSMTKALNEGRTDLVDVWNQGGRIQGPYPTKRYDDDGLFREKDRKLFWDTYLNRKPKKIIIEITEDMLNRSPDWDLKLIPHETQFLGDKGSFPQEIGIDTQKG